MSGLYECRSYDQYQEHWQCLNDGISVWTLDQWILAARRATFTHQSMPVCMLLAPHILKALSTMPPALSSLPYIQQNNHTLLNPACQHEHYKPKLGSPNGLLPQHETLPLYSPKQKENPRETLNPVCMSCQAAFGSVQDLSTTAPGSSVPEIMRFSLRL